ncbi:Gfo/Idh/MocA family protein [Chryseolinea lacunae]|uniref:Gfo/Idh/MocA family oxidoreductase n=1 Tax=Chryseolinea lacunae TaxID=2801331 RepID=A0ABS1KZ60_9BACT|nr:Gfo/Idh/MocA family oxidoreductase [Chryseolinea lacunae]MBL0744463.1 Gfo/Idh/MocA family oxidoreductase [Chryseolinea lacunae]
MNNRRDFIKQATLAGAGIFVAPNVFSFVGSPNEKVVIGMVGTNSRGWALATMFAKLPNVEVGYICDVDDNVIAKTVAEIEKISGKKPQGIKDVRKLLEIKDVDAIVIAAPDHWHAPAAMLALKAGKHVYVEKPCSHNPAEGEMLVAGAAKYNKLVQMGSQRRSFPKVMEAMQELHAGAIGRVYFAKGWYANGRKPIGTGKVAPVPATLDFELWQGPAPRREYKDNLVPYNWHWFWHWGTGEALNNGTHEMDVMRWGLGVDYPTKVVSAGGRFAYKDDWETPDTQTITFEFNNNTAMTWEGRSCNSFGVEGVGRGVVFYGEKGTMLIPGGDDYKIFDPANKLIKEVKTDLQAADAVNTMGMGERLDGMHLLNFVEAVRGKTKLNAPISEGHKSTLLPQLGNIAYRTGATLYCDPANGHIKDNPKATALWKREYEKGWEMKL